MSRGVTALTLRGVSGLGRGRMVQHATRPRPADAPRPTPRHTSPGACRTRPGLGRGILPAGGSAGASSASSASRPHRPGVGGSMAGSDHGRGVSRPRWVRRFAKGVSLGQRGLNGGPTTQWTAQQVIEAFPWNKVPRYLLGDCDGSIIGGAGCSVGGIDFCLHHRAHIRNYGKRLQG